MTAAEKCYFQEIPPRTSNEDGGRQVVQNVATGAAAVKTAVFTGLSKPPEGDVMVTFEAVTQDVFVRFRSDAGAAATTTSNGMIIKAGTQKRWFLSPLKDVFVDHIAGGVGVLKWYVSSPVYDHYKASGT